MNANWLAGNFGGITTNSPIMTILLSFGVYSLQATATIYVDGTMGGGRQGAFLAAVELLMYTDLQPEDGYVWVNGACAEYYGKESVTVTIEE